MAPTNAIAGPEVHDRGIMQLAPELTIDGPHQDGYSLAPTGPASQRLVFFIGEDQFGFRTTGARHTPFYNFLHEFTAQDTR